MGWVLSLGVGFILLATLVVLPALFELFGKRTEDAEESRTASADGVPGAPRKIGGNLRG